MGNTSRKFLQLPWELKRIVLRSVLILPMTYAGLGLFGFKRLLAGIQHLAPVGGRVPDRCPEVQIKLGNGLTSSRVATTFTVPQLKNQLGQF